MRLSRVILPSCLLLTLGFVGVSRLSTLSAQNAVEPRHQPANAVANLDVHPQLQATLFASEPTLTNPTNLDIDARGRIWVCDVMNYRRHNNSRPEGDRILILEDTNGDGVSDKTTLYYQGRDIDSAMGICVLGNKVIVSASPNVLIFTDEDGDDKPDKKEVFFSKTGQPQHDHSAHSFVFGPDGKLYWNFGNTGKSVHDRDGKIVVDRAGNPVVDNGKPYFGGMAFRCDLDGSNFEVLGHNFRNNYEVTVDSFGTLWQSDNDDDGNRGVRINYVMEFGNFGYLDQMTGAGWRTPRTNMEKEVPLQHWHLNDPGVVPNLLQTGQGSPTGICVYEGELLPEVFHGQVIHCDAGPSITRAYPVKKDGAGYSAEVVNILDGAKKNIWFRPADVCVAPDGSLFVTDWYDPGVGGHNQQDVNRGRIFRVAPPGSKYNVPKFDFETTAGAVEAMKNPNLAARYLAWTALHQMGEKAEPELLKLYKSDDPILRARALWLLGKTEGRGQHYVNLALEDADPDIRVTGIRLARQVVKDYLPLLEKVIKDKAPEVRRECAIALRHLSSPKAAELWAELASQHDGKDRWYLEALGIGADLHWEACLAAWLSRVGDKATATPANRDIIWRSRSDKTPLYLANIILNANSFPEPMARYFRAFDFQSGPNKDKALLELLAKLPSDKTDAIVEAINRLKSVDVNKVPGLSRTLEEILKQSAGTQRYLDIVGRFSLAPHYPAVLQLALKQPEGQLGVNAVRLLLDKGQQNLLQSSLYAKDREQALATALALGTTGDDRTSNMLLELAENDKYDLELRRQAIRAVAKTRTGARTLIRLARQKKLDDNLKDAAGVSLNIVPWKEIRDDAVKLFPLPAAKGEKPLPPFADLVKMRGDVNRGKIVFAKAGTCANCHIVNGEGKEVGPDLSEVGKKLSREALLESILFPSAGISHNYEAYVVELKDGGIETGVMVSDTPDSITIKRHDAIVKMFKKADVDALTKSPVSIMPADLQKTLTPQDLADLLDYMQTLKQARKPSQ